MARYDENEIDPWINERKKLLRRWEEYFGTLSGNEIIQKPNVSDEELQVIFCYKFKYAVLETIKFKGEKVIPNKFPLSYLFYSIFRNL